MKTKPNPVEQEAAALIEQPVKISISILPRNKFQKLLQDKNILPKKRVFHVRPLCLGSLVRISKLLSVIDTEVFKELTHSQTLELMQKHGATLAKIAAIAVTNEKKQPPKSLIQFFLHNLTAKEMVALMQVVLRQMDIQSFLIGIISARNLNVIEMNPERKGS